MITSELEPRLYEYIGGILRGIDAVLLQIGGMPDHVHLLIGLRQDQAVADVVRILKANSSKWVHETPPFDKLEFGWQGGYGAFTVSKSQLDTVQHYIQNQPAHYLKREFEDEFKGLLRNHDINFEDKYLWS
jgi:REP element-mobilizing transposase RayT